MGKFSFFSRPAKGKGRLRRLLIEMKGPMGSEASAAVTGIMFKERGDAPTYIGIQGNPQECFGLLTTLLVQMARMIGQDPVTLSEKITQALKEHPEAIQEIHEAADAEAKPQQKRNNASRLPVL